MLHSKGFVSVAGLVLSATILAGGAELGTVHTFATKSRGIAPFSPLTADSQGNLYGTTFNGGIPGRPNNTCAQYEGGCGTVYKLSQNATGLWAYTVLYEFKGGPADGQNPTDVLAIDSAGNIYGTTFYGGAKGAGAVYELSPSRSGAYGEKVIYSFTGGNGMTSTDGFAPNGIIMDAAGKLYGTTTYGGQYQTSGTVFELSTTSGGGWTETVLYSFGNGSDGRYPRSGLLADSAGNLYGTTSAGGTFGNGTVFKLTPGAGSWTESFVYSFGATGTGDGCSPWSRLTADSAGTLYGTTTGCAGFGTVFKMTPSGSGYFEKIIHYFLNTPTGAGPLAPVTLSAAGNIYGTTSSGGRSGYGAVFKLTPNGGGYVESEIHSFSGGADGAGPNYGVILGPNGLVYGTTGWGGSGPGTSGYGVIFSYQP